MNWTTISAYSGDSWSRFYSNSAIFKSHFTADIQSGSSATFSSDFYNLSTRLYNTSAAGLTNSFLNAKFTNADRDLNYTEFNDITGADVMAFKEASGTCYLTNIWFDLPDGKTAVLHIGLNTNNTTMAMTNSDAAIAAFDILPLITTLQSANNSLGTDYIVQPLYIYDIKTPIFMVSGNTELAAFTVFALENKKFMVVGKGICVEIE